MALGVLLYVGKGVNLGFKGFVFVVHGVEMV